MEAHNTRNTYSKTHEILVGLFVFSLLLSCITSFIAICSPDWAKSVLGEVKAGVYINANYEMYIYGLWQYCSIPVNSGRICRTYIYIIYDNWIQYCQFCSILAILLNISAFLYWFWNKANSRIQFSVKYLAYTSVIMGLNAFISLTIIIVYAFRYKQSLINSAMESNNLSFKIMSNLTWAFGLYSIGTIFSIIGTLSSALNYFVTKKLINSN
ncbi:hypothetical protein A3Q56_08316 [Intoshia linei]|uniref:Claudin n=1 Tax=Intoshia linei TaxID=1819745 RepID=A0A177APN1_9BILA|nr:hypothetical protein A3Q56_08316 [Intoshia linei]